MIHLDPNKALDALNSGRVNSVDELCKFFNTIAKTEERLSQLDSQDVTENREQSSQDDTNPPTL